MLRIREEQLRQFEPQADAALVARIVEHLHEEHADVTDTLPDDVLREMVEAGMARARGHGLTWESSLAAFVALMFEIAPNFDEHPRVRHYLDSSTVPPDERLNRLAASLSDEDWEAIERDYDAAAWFPVEAGE